jgi:hypothetical protein
MKYFIVLLMVILIYSCSGSKTLSEQLPIIPPTRFDRKYFPNLPYKEIVRTIHSNRDLSKSNYLNNKKFKDYTHDINTTILEAVLDIGGIPNYERMEIKQSFNEKKDSLSNLIYSDFLKEIKSTNYLPQKNLLINYDVSLSVDAFSNVLSSRICSIIGIAITLSGIPKVYSISSSLFCEKLLSNLLMPILEELKNQALIMDYVNAEIRITEHIRELIFELATVQDKFKSELKTQPTRKFFFDIFESKATLEIYVNATIKAGFDLKDKFDVKFSETDKLLIVYLPRAKILSNEFDYDIKKMEDGWLIKIDKNHLNNGMKEMKRRLKNEALQSGILLRAESHADLIIMNLLKPLMENKRFKFDIKIVFVN